MKERAVGKEEEEEEEEEEERLNESQRDGVAHLLVRE